MLMKCSCRHTGQDNLHGEGIRVFNKVSKENSFRCSVCKTEKGAGTTDDPKKKGKK
jgi:hypothetical protein